MKFASIAFVAAAVLAPVQLSAQSAGVVVGAPSKQNALSEGTEIMLRTTTEISSKESKVGDRFNLEVAEPVKLNGQIVIPVGAPAVGEIVKVDKKGMFGKSGKLDTRLLYVKLGDQQIRIRGKVGERGKGGTAAAVGSTLLFLPAGFFVTGKSAIVAPGTAVAGYLEADLPVTFAK